MSFGYDACVRFNISTFNDDEEFEIPEWSDIGERITGKTLKEVSLKYLRKYIEFVEKQDDDFYPNY